MVTNYNGTPVTDAVFKYKWNTTGCYRNNAFNSGTPRCFPHGKTNQTITGGNLTAKDAGTITCEVTDLIATRTSMPLTLRLSGNIPLPY